VVISKSRDTPIHRVLTIPRLVLCESDQCAPGQALQRQSHAVALAHPEGQKRPVVGDGGFNDVSAIVRRLNVEELGHAGRLNR
jgi:hypothetical protein